MLVEMLSLEGKWTGTITTGATASNILALGCARDALYRRMGHDPEEGPGSRVSVFVALPHASIKKAASIVGIGRNNVRDMSSRMQILDFDLPRLEEELAVSPCSIVVVGFGEVNTGALTAQIPALRALCDKYNAWLHIDAAFSAFVALLPEFSPWASAHLSMADSITSDAHKQLNVPYDAGLLFLPVKGDPARSELDELCGPGSGAAPAYLSAGSVSNDSELQEQIAGYPSPLNVNLVSQSARSQRQPCESICAFL